MHSMNTTFAGITLNGEPFELAAETESVRDVLIQSDIDTERQGIAVALNDAVVPRARWESAPVSPGDVVEVIGAVQGG